MKTFNLRGTKVKIGDYPIPFRGGNQLEFPNWNHDTIEWIDNHMFQDELSFESFSRGRSAVTFHMTRAMTNNRVTMFASNFVELVPYFKNGVVRGTFTFVKKGQNYGCKLLLPEVE